MGNKKFLKTMAATIMATMCMSVTVASAASIGSSLNANAAKVTTTFNSGSSGYHTVQVIGYEKHPQTGHCPLYNVTNGKSGGGNLSTVHSAHTGYQFQKSCSGITLSSTVRLNGSFVGTIITT